MKVLSRFSLICSLWVLPLVSLATEVALANVSGQDAQTNRLVASLYAQIDELKEQIRTVRGDIEQLQFENAKLNEKFTKFSSDIEFRLTETEREKAKPKGDSVLDNIDLYLDNDRLVKTGEPTPTANNHPAASQVPQKEQPTSDSKQPIKPDNFVAKKTKEKNMEQDYQDAYSYIKDKQYKKAQDLFKAFVENYPDSSLLGSAEFWLGETYYLSNDFKAAAVEYLKGYQASMRGSRAPDNLLKLAKSLAKLDKKKEACTTLMKLKKEFPKASNVIKKQMEEDIKTLRCVQ